MTDEELSAISAGFKTVIQEQVLALRTQIADLRADLDAERTKTAQLRLLEAESQRRMLRSLADAVGDAVAPRFAALERRAVDLEQRAIDTAPGVTQ